MALEALVRGVPVIASADGGLGEVLADPARGLLFPNGDTPALAGRLEEVASGRAFPDHCVAEEVVVRAREEFALDRNLSSLRGILAEVAGLASPHQGT